MRSILRAELGWWLPGYRWPGDIVCSSQLKMEGNGKKEKGKSGIQLDDTPGQFAQSSNSPGGCRLFCIGIITIIHRFKLEISIE